MLGSEPPKEQLADWAVNCLLGPYASLYVLGFCTRTTSDTARVLEAILDNDKSTDDLIDELADLVSGLNPVVRDVRKAMKGGE